MVSDILSAALAACGALSCQDHQGPTAVERSLPNVVLDTALVASADTYVRGGTPNTNYGADLFLRNMASDRRPLVRFDQAQIAAVVGADSLASATLELTVSVAGINWGSPGRYIDLHRLTQTWTELGATWNCAIDADLGDGVATCEGANAWVMGSPPSSNPWIATPTANVLVSEGMAGVVQFNVTADVRAFLAGTANYAWLLKKADESAEGRIDFASKESTAKPRLLLTIVQGDTSRPVLPSTFTVTASDTLTLASPPNDTGNVFFRRLVGVRFDDSTSGTRVRSFLAKYGAAVVGGYPRDGEYVLRVPDPGSSYAGLSALVVQMRGEIGVMWARTVAYRSKVVVDARFPTDGQNATRADWFSANLTNATWPRVAVRVPLAWGCENGDYGSVLPRIAVVDCIFDDQHPDFQRVGGGSNVAGVLLPATVAFGQPVTSTIVRHHGTEVSGVIGAVGNNSTGVAGMLWRSELYLLGLAKADSSPIDVAGEIASRIFPLAESLGVRVLNVSLTVETTDSTSLPKLTRAVARYLRSGGVIVQSSGNAGLSRTAAELRSWPSRVPSEAFHVLKVALARIMQDSAAIAGRILFVVGTNRQGGRWVDAAAGEASNYFSGITQIAAPAESIQTLGLRALIPSGVVVVSGTSLAAPFVTGAAGMLLASYPALTADSLVRYLLDGAIQPRIKASDGSTYVPSPITGMSDAHLLDAYGALTKLSRDHQATPLCGAQVFVDSTAFALTAEWAGVSRSIPVPLVGNELATHVSATQGGRRLAVHTQDNNTERSLVLNQTGQLIRTVANARRVYLERDTADLAFDVVKSYPLLTVRGPSYPTPLVSLDLFSNFVSQQNVSGRGRIDVAPTADYVLIRYGTVTFCTLDEFARLVAIPSQTQVLVTSARLADCSGGTPTTLTNSVWSNDARRVVVGRLVYATPPATGWALAGPSIAPVPPVNVSGILAKAATFTADDSLLVSYEGNASNPCVRQYRNAAAPQTPAGSPTPVSVDHCVDDAVVHVVAIPGAPRTVVSPATHARFDLFRASLPGGRHSP